MTNFENKDLQNTQEHVSIEPVPYTPSKYRNRIISVIGGLFVIGTIVNGYFLFKDDSKVERAYYISQHEYQVASHYEHFLEKRAIVASKEVIQLTEDATKLDEISVRVGDIVYTDDVLAHYNEAARDQLVKQLEIERDAYKEELRGLELALSEVSRQANMSPPTSNVNTNQIAEFISVQVQMEIAQYHTSSEAIALLNGHIAEVERKISITDQLLSEAKVDRTLNSTIEGSIGDIRIENGYVTFEIHSSDKNVVTYVTEDEWRNIELDQAVTLQVDGYDEPIDGFISEIQELPANDSIWLSALKENSSEAKGRLYEIRIEVSDLLLLAPFGSNSLASVTIQVLPDSFISPSQWIVDKEVELVSDHHHYIIGYDGKIRLQPIRKMATAPVEQWQPYNRTSDEELSSDEELTSDDIVEEELYPLAEDQLLQMKQHAENAEVTDLITFTMDGEISAVLISSNQREDYANAFTALPLRTFSFDNIYPMTWKDILRYIFY